MKTTLAICLAVMGGMWMLSSPVAVADETPAVTTGVVTAALAADEKDAAEYVGSKDCKKCHSKVFKSWEASKHAKAMDSLKPDAAKEAKEKAKLDPAKDYSKDAKCLECHAVGFGKKGGYAVPASEEDKDAAKKTAALAGVGCESCHGPGSKFVPVHDEIMKSKRTYKAEEMTKAGTVKPDEKACVACHNEKSPTHDPAAKFDFKAMSEKGVHEHEELKQLEKK